MQYLRNCYCHAVSSCYAWRVMQVVQETCVCWRNWSPTCVNSLEHCAGSHLVERLFSCRFALRMRQLPCITLYVPSFHFVFHLLFRHTRKDEVRVAEHASTDPWDPTLSRQRRFRIEGVGDSSVLPIRWFTRN